MLLDRMLTGSGVRGLVTDGSGRANPDVMVTVDSLGDNGLASSTSQVKADGTYHLILKPGMYRLTFMLNGMMAEREITISNNRVDLDVTLGLLGH